MSAPPAPPAIRQWAIANSIPGVGQRGPVGYEALVAYAQAHGLPEPERLERAATPPSPAAKPRKPRTWAGPSCSCGRRWEGLKECHCSRCHVHFRSEFAFDAHLLLIPNTEDTRCVDPLTIEYRSGVHKGERKFREIMAHHGLIIVRAEDRPDQEEIQSR